MADDLTTPDDYEGQLAKWAHDKIVAGASADDVAAKVTELTHAYRRSLATKTDALGPETGGERAAGAISAAYQGLTLGAGNKITAGIRTVLPQALGGTKGFDYPEALKENTDVLDQYRYRHPLESTALQVAGAIPTALVGGAAAAPSSLGKLAAQGAGYGTVAGGAEAIRPGATVGDVAGGAAGGAVTGAIAAPVLGAVMKAPSAVSRIARMMGGQSAPEQADQMIAAQLAKARALPPAGGGVRGQPIDMYEPGLSDAFGYGKPAAPPPTTIMELGGPNVTKLVRTARNVPTSTAETQTTEFLQQRAADTADRLHEALTVGTGHAPEEVNLTDQALQQAKETAAKPAYEKAFASPAIPLSASAGEGTPTLAELLQRPSAKAALSYGDKLSAEQGQAPLSERFDVGVPGPVRSGQFSPEQWTELVKKNPGLEGGEDAIPVQDLHALKTKLDDLIGYAKAGNPIENGPPATKAYLRAVQDTKNGILDIMDQHAPAYGEARNGYAGASNVQDALAQGKDDFAASVRPSEVEQNRALLKTDSEREFYDRGMLSAARDVIEKNAANPDLPQASRQVNIVQRLLGNKAQAQKIQGLFPDQTSYQNFLGQMEQEAQYPATAKALLNQSTTASQLAEGATKPGVWRDLATAGMGSKYALYNLGSRVAGKVGLGPSAMSPAVADAIGQRATLTGPAMQALVQRYGEVQAPKIAAAALRQQIAGREAGVLPSAIEQAMRALQPSQRP